MENDISFSQLRCFVAVVDAGSLAEAGRQLGMSTASVSKSIARLEQTTGAKLLYRSTHALSLTDDGERLVEPAREAVRAAGAFRQSAVARAPSGWVRISAPVALMRDVLTPALADFTRRHPEIDSTSVPATRSWISRATESISRFAAAR